MGYFEAGGVQFAPLPEGVSPTLLVNGQYHDTGAYGQAPAAGAPFYKDVPIDFVDIDGVANVRHGFRGRMIFATLVWAGTLAYCHSQSKDDLEAMSANARYTIALPDGETFEGCKMIPPNPGKFENLSNGVVLVMPCLFIQLSETN